ncbi:MAG TPA: DUF3883 domain-containing protein [Phycisphaerae bacterium]|nr:DUF3883 domain-containing protein [Phycisphaerae bacterium]
MAMLAHATLATDDSRKRLIDHSANRYVLSKLAEMLAEVAEVEATSSSNDRGINLLAGAQLCDEELVRLGFREALLHACRGKRLLPRLDGTVGTLESVRLPGNDSIYEIASPRQFPELLNLSHEEGGAFARTMGVAAYTSKELATRLEATASAMAPAEAGAAIGKVLSGDAIPRDPLPNLLRDAAGQVIPSNQVVFLPPEKGIPSLPDWASAVSIMHHEFAEGLRKTLGVSTVRDLRYQLTSAGYSVEEFQVESLARRLGELAHVDGDVPHEVLSQRCRDLLVFLYKMMANEYGDVTSIRTPVKVPTERGNLVAANTCYLSDAYPSGRLVCALYAPLEKDEFVADPEAIGLGGEDLAHVEEFLVRLGVSRVPRMVRVSPWEFEAAGLEGFIDHIVENMQYPNMMFGQKMASPAEVRKTFHNIQIADLRLPDRFTHLVRSSPPEAVVAYLATDGFALLTEEVHSSAKLEALTGNQRNHRPYAAVRVPNPLIFILRREEWVPCDDSSRRRPERIFLNRVGSRAFKGTFFAHSIRNDHELLRPLGGRACAESILLRVGAVSSLDTMRADDLYRMLMELPERDPEGKNASSIYRSLVETGGIDTDSPLRERFEQEGLMWGQRGRHTGYFPVRELRYCSRLVLPKPLRRQVPLVDIDAKRSTKEIDRIFGIPTLRQEDIHLDVEAEGSEYRSWSHLAYAHVKMALAYLYAFRLSRTADANGEERRGLVRVELFICKSVRARVTVEGSAREPIILSDDLEGLVVGHKLFLISGEEDFPQGDQLFWRAVADLLADAVNASVSSDFAALLSCDSPRQMSRMLDRMTEGHAEELLERARGALNLADETDGEAQVMPIPRPTETLQSSDLLPPGAQRPQQLLPVGKPPGTSEAAPGQAKTGNLGEFRPTAPPKASRPQSRRSFVVATKPRTPTVRVQLVDETETLHIVEMFEEVNGRFPIVVSHLRGFEGPRCDIISFESDEIRRVATETQAVRLQDVTRFIEVKGRSSRTGAVQLPENEYNGAQAYGQRYFIYRVFCDPTASDHIELAVLQNPISCPTMKITRTAQFDLNDRSGANWFELVNEDEGDQS